MSGEIAFGREKRRQLKDVSFGGGGAPVFTRRGWIAEAPDWAFVHGEGRLLWCYLASGSIVQPDARLFYREWAYFRMPYWFALCLVLLWPASRVLVVLRRWRERRRVLMGLCTKCGYELRATPERCPECGTAVASRVVL